MTHNSLVAKIIRVLRLGANLQAISTAVSVIQSGISRTSSQLPVSAFAWKCETDRSIILPCLFPPGLMILNRHYTHFVGDNGSWMSIFPCVFGYAYYPCRQRFGPHTYHSVDSQSIFRSVRLLPAIRVAVCLGKQKPATTERSSRSTGDACNHSPGT